MKTAYHIWFPDIHLFGTYDRGIRVTELTEGLAVNKAVDTLRTYHRVWEFITTSGAKCCVGETSSEYKTFWLQIEWEPRVKLTTSIPKHRLEFDL